MGDAKRLLDVQSVTRRYGQRTALAGVTLEVSGGSCFALLGPNGAGKSTLIRCIATLARPDEGDIRVSGRSVLAQPLAVRRELGIVFQQPLLDRNLTGREAVEHHAKLYGVRRVERRRRLTELARTLGVEGRLDERVRRLSGGLARRVDLVRALVTDPAVLILDEPTAGLDLATRRRLWDFLRALAQQGKAVLLATHDMEEAEAVADRVGILHQGRLLAEGNPGELKEGLGVKVVRIESPDPRQLGEALAAEPGLEDVTAVPGGLEVAVREGRGSAAHVLDLLESRDLPYTRATVRAPTLADLFLKLTGHDLYEAPVEPAEMAAAAMEAPREGEP